MDHDSRRAEFELVTAEVYAPLQRYLRRRCALTDVDDVFNEVLLTIWRKIDVLPAAPRLAWCYGVARRCLANHRRGAARRLRLVRRIEAHSPRQSPSEQGSDLEAQLHDALGELPELDREMMRLWAWERLEPREIAVAMGVTPNSVSVRLARVRARLASELARQNPVGAGHKTGEGQMEMEP